MDRISALLRLQSVMAWMAVRCDGCCPWPGFCFAASFVFILFDFRISCADLILRRPEDRLPSGRRHKMMMMTNDNRVLDG
jgi:hypothetical protein